MELSDGSKVCLDCEAIFFIDDGEKQYFEDHGMTQPKRCRDCRQLRKDLRHQADVDRAAKTLGVTDEQIKKQNDMIIMLELLDEI